MSGIERVHKYRHLESLLTKEWTSEQKIRLKRRVDVTNKTLNCKKNVWNKLGLEDKDGEVFDMDFFTLQVKKWITRKVMRKN